MCVRRKILVVDDEPHVRDWMESLLRAEGYDVETAEDGLDALRRLLKDLPDIIISDLNMPQMSGFEFLSVVRRRFPDIPSIAASGAYKAGEEIPGGVIADAFFAKGRQQSDDLIRAVDGVLQSASQRRLAHSQEPAPSWIPRSGKDSKGVPFIVLACTECLRSFALSVQKEGVQEIQETRCLYCDGEVRYFIDFSLSVVSPKAQLAGKPGSTVLPAAKIPLQE